LALGLCVRNCSSTPWSLTHRDQGNLSDFPGNHLWFSMSLLERIPSNKR
jgi:hypothetical protein